MYTPEALPGLKRRGGLLSGGLSAGGGVKHSKVSVTHIKVKKVTTYARSARARGAKSGRRKKAAVASRAEQLTWCEPARAARPRGRCDVCIRVRAGTSCDHAVCGVNGKVSSPSVLLTLDVVTATGAAQGARHTPQVRRERTGRGIGEAGRAEP